MNLALNESPTTILNNHFRQRPIDYLQHMTMTLSKIETSKELEQLIEDFLLPDTLEMLENNKEIMQILAYVWNNAIRRVVFTPEQIVFPNLLLLFPPLYHALQWTDEQNQEWNATHLETLRRFEQQPKLDEAIMLLFLEGMRYSLYDALMIFKSRSTLLRSKTDRVRARQLEWELQQYGWPDVELRYLA